MIDLQKNIGHTFSDITLLEKALMHRSCGSVNNERMEFLGDSFLNFVSAELIHETFPRLPEGQMSRTRAGMVREEALVKVAEKLNLERFIKIVITERNSTVNPSMMADAVEAIFAAVYLDAGFDAARTVVRKHMIWLLDSGLAILRKDPKTALQEKLQSHGLGLPVYSLVSEDQGSTKERYQASCVISELNIKTTGVGATRKLAEMAAAESAYRSTVL